MRKALVLGAVAIHPLVHVATLGLDDIIILITVGVIACLSSR